jgi:acyl-[acyl-carrier-protein]-phospholipid O-acyltransferase/long-chain-fatty-acid--[acyl-carrier-protein] ligase
MGVHSTFFGPLKYSIIPDHLAKDELVSANGYIEAATFVGILIGSLLGGLYNSFEYLIMGIMLATSLVGFVSSLLIPKSNNFVPEMRINLNLFEETKNIIQYSYSKKHIFLCILGISWFWFIGAAFLAEIPMLSKNIFGANESVANLFLAIFLYRCRNRFILV